MSISSKNVRGGVQMNMAMACTAHLCKKSTIVFYALVVSCEVFIGFPLSNVFRSQNFGSYVYMCPYNVDVLNSSIVRFTL